MGLPRLVHVPPSARSTRREGGTRATTTGPRTARFRVVAVEERRVPERSRRFRDLARLPAAGRLLGSRETRGSPFPSALRRTARRELSQRARRAPLIISHSRSSPARSPRRSSSARLFRPSSRPPLINILGKAVIARPRHEALANAESSGDTLYGLAPGCERLSIFFSFRTLSFFFFRLFLA